MARVAIVCEKCWSDSVQFRASCDWSVEKQEYNIIDIEDADWCSQCDCECIVEEFDVDDKDEVQFPTVDEIIESSNPDHMIAKGEMLDDEVEIDRLYQAILTEDDGEAHSLEDKVRFVRFVDCDPTLVEDILVNETHRTPSVVARIMASYILRVTRGDSKRVTEALIAMASKVNKPDMLKSLLRPYDNPLPAAELDRLRTVFKLLGGIDDNIYR